MKRTSSTLLLGATLALAADPSFDASSLAPLETQVRAAMGEARAVAAK